MNQAFYAEGNVATAGGCLSSHYLAAWLVARLAGVAEAENALQQIRPYLPTTLSPAIAVA